jgi:hypothetical protein
VGTLRKLPELTEGQIDCTLDPVSALCQHNAGSHHNELALE